MWPRSFNQKWANQNWFIVLMYMLKIKTAKVTRVGDAKNADGINVKKPLKLDSMDKSKRSKPVATTIIFLIIWKWKAN